MSSKSNANDLSEIFMQVADAPRDEQAALLEKLCPDKDCQRQVLQLLEVDAAADPLLDHALFPEPIDLKPGDRVAGYRLVKELALGGMGIVYLAEQLEPIQRQVALKVIKPGVDTREVIKRFSAESQALSLMDHPGIAKVFDAGSTDTGRPFFVMELVNGQPLTTYCEEKQLSVNQRLEIFVSVCKAIQHAHQKGIIHRDIKPSNVMVAEYDGKPVAKVIDFGVAKAINQTMSSVKVATGFGQIIGTIDYMSPEQSRQSQDEVDTRSDIYSLGVLLYELLTDTPPFDRERLRSADLDVMLRIIREEVPPRPSARLQENRGQDWAESHTQLETPTQLHLGRADSKVPRSVTTARAPHQLRSRIRLVRGELDWIVMKAMEKEPNRRYATPDELAADVERFMSGQAVLACPPSPLYLFRKFASRNKTVLAASALVAFSILLGIAGVGYQTLRASKAEAKANQDAFEFIIENVLGADQTTGLDGYSPDPNVKLMLLVQKAEKRVEERFADNPELKSRMKGTLAKVFNSVGLHGDASRLYREYLDQLIAIRGPTDPESIRAMRNMVRIHLNESQLRDAEALGKKALQYSQEHLGGEHETTLLLLDDLAMLYHKQSNHGLAVDTYLMLLEIRERKLGPKHPDTLATMSNLGAAYDLLGQYAESKPLHEDVLRLYEPSSFTDAQLALAMMRLGKWCLRDARLTQTRAEYQRAAELLDSGRQIYERNLGPEHTDTLASVYYLAQAYLELMQLEDAELLLTQLLDQLEILRRSREQMALNAMNMLGWTYLRQSKVVEAENVLHTAYERLREIDRRDELTVQVMENLAIVRYQMGKLDDAVFMDEQTQKLASEVLGPKHTATLAAEARLTVGYREQASEADADRLLDQTQD